MSAVISFYLPFLRLSLPAGHSRTYVFPSRIYYSSGKRLTRRYLYR